MGGDIFPGLALRGKKLKQTLPFLQGVYSIVAMEIPQADLLGTMFAALIYGAYLSLFIKHMLLLYRRRSNGCSFLYVCGTTILLFVLITANLAIGMTFTMQGYMAGMTEPKGSMKFFEATLLCERLETLLYDGVTLVCALFLVYRCFVLWDRSYCAVSIPVLMLLANIGLFLRNIFVSQENLNGPFIALTLSQNLLSTTMIIWKILSLQKTVAANLTIGSRQPISHRIAIVLIESAAIYSVGESAILATVYLQSPLFRTFSNWMIPVLGLNFSAIVLRNSRTHKLPTEGTLSSPNFSESPFSNIEEISSVGCTANNRVLEDRLEYESSNTLGARSIHGRVVRDIEVEKPSVSMV